MTTRGQSLACVTLGTNVFAQIDSQVLFLGGYSRRVEHKAR